MHELDQTQLRRAYARTAPGYDEADFFCAEVRDRLLERLEFITLEPETIVDLGGGTGQTAMGLRERYPNALIINLDCSHAMLQADETTDSERICADSHHLPLPDDCADMVVSNLMLPGCAIPESVFAEARRVLKNPGLFLFSTLGPDSLKQLRRAWARVDNAPHVHPFADMHNVGDALVGAGFREPVMDVEMMTVNYTELNALIADLRNVAATNHLTNRRRGLTTPRLWQRMMQELESSRNKDGRLPLSMEVVTGQAWTGEPGRGVMMEDGVAAFPVSRLRG